MTKPLVLTVAACCFSVLTIAQKPFRCNLTNDDHKINLVIDLYEESIVAPGMEMFGPMHGYMNGDIYGTWIVTSAKVSTGNEAILHLSNDLGSETQEAELTMENDSIFSLKLTDGVVIKKVVKKKLVKIPQKIVFKRIIDERF